MRVLVAPDSFKGSLSATEATNAIVRGARDAPRSTDDSTLAIRELPLADGGEGFAPALTAALGGTIHHAQLQGPLDEKITAEYGVCVNDDGEGVAVLDAASVIGLPLVPPLARRPRVLTSRPLAGLIRAALRHNPRHIILGVGGTSTMDLGLGALEALGALPLGHRRGHIHASPDAIPQVTGFEVRPRSIAEHLATRGSLTIACDVDSPLLGPIGAARTFGPQKGASPDDVERLETDFALFVSRAKARGVEIDPDAPGMGAAGGIPYGFAVALGADVRPGFDVLAEAVRLHDAVAEADLVITGEGAFDHQSLHGKVVGSLAERCLAAPEPPAFVVLAGRVNDSWRHGLRHDDPRRDYIAVRPIADDATPDDERLGRAADLLHAAARDAVAACARFKQPTTTGDP